MNEGKGQRAEGKEGKEGRAKARARRGFIASAGLGMAALFAGAGRVAAADWNEGEKANVKTVNDFCAAWSSRDMARVLPFLADDCVYRMSETTPAVNGHAGVTGRLKTWLDDSTLVEFRVLDTAAAGPIVINHRIDRFLTARPLTWEGVGVFYVKDGKIKEWSDYTIKVQR
jgi:limonene-1,2-epoxide hydrolase